MKSTMMGFQLTLAPILERAGTLYPKVEIVSRMPDRSLHRCTYSDVYCARVDSRVLCLQPVYSAANAWPL